MNIDDRPGQVVHYSIYHECGKGGLVEVCLRDGTWSGRLCAHCDRDQIRRLREEARP